MTYAPAIAMCDPCAAISMRHPHTSFKLLTHEGQALFMGETPDAIMAKDVQHVHVPIVNRIAPHDTPRLLIEAQRSPKIIPGVRGMERRCVISEKPIELRLLPEQQLADTRMDSVGAKH